MIHLIFFLFLFCIYSLLYFVLKRKEKYDEAEKARLDAASKQADLGETTHM